MGTSSDSGRAMNCLRPAEARLGRVLWSETGSVKVDRARPGARADRVEADRAWSMDEGQRQGGLVRERPSQGQGSGGPSAEPTPVHRTPAADHRQLRVANRQPPAASDEPRAASRGQPVADRESVATSREPSATGDQRPATGDRRPATGDRRNLTPGRWPLSRRLLAAGRE